MGASSPVCAPGRPSAQSAVLIVSARVAATLRGMYGPLNGVRVALVAAATLAALTAAALGYWSATVMLLAAVALHGAGWVYLAQRAKADSKI